MTPNVIFAENMTHARAMMSWLRFDASLWHPNVYGGKLCDEYDRAVIIRPLSGITQEHYIWVLAALTPLMPSPDRISPLHWNYDDQESSEVDEFEWIRDIDIDKVDKIINS